MKWFDSWSQKTVLRRLAGVRSGRLRVMDGPHRYEFGPGSADPGLLRATLRVHDPRFWRRIATGGNIGAAEAYRDGWWSADDLPALIRLLTRDMHISEDLERGPARWKNWLRARVHRRRRNTKAGSRRNVEAHYDLGNAFFERWLDPSMTYSCGIYPSEHANLEEASKTKLERVCQKLAVGPEHHVLEVGSGWGSLALHLVRTRGCRVTTLTLSQEQKRVAEQRIADAGLQDRVEVLLRDYRAMVGQFDRLVSIEMIEAVGHDHHETFFRQCASLTKPAGRMVLQAITLADQRYRAALKAPDFIQHHIFPGSALTSVTRLCEVATRATPWRLVHLEDIGVHYARTLSDWRERFLAERDSIEALGYSPEFCRLWEFYLAYCEAGFAERNISTVQAVFEGATCVLGPIPAVGPTVSENWQHSAWSMAVDA